MDQSPDFLGWERPWVQLDRVLAYVIGRRMEEGPSPPLEATLDLLMAQHRKVEQAGWFNEGGSEPTRTCIKTGNALFRRG